MVWWRCVCHLRALSKTNRQLLGWSAYRGESYAIDHKSVEHIYPQRALDPYWKKQFQDFSVQEKNILRNSLGNLMPVSSPKNSSLSNKSFEAKKGSIQNQVGYRYGCLTEIQVSHEKDWGPGEILRRGIHLLRFLEDRWRIPMGDDAQKSKLLALDFVPARMGQSLESIMKQPLPTPTLEDAPPSRAVRRRVKVIS
jgi:hypothetical protein